MKIKFSVIKKYIITLNGLHLTTNLRKTFYIESSNIKIQKLTRTATDALLVRFDHIHTRMSLLHMYV